MAAVTFVHPFIFKIFYGFTIDRIYFSEFLIDISRQVFATEIFCKHYAMKHTISIEGGKNNFYIELMCEPWCGLSAVKKLSIFVVVITLTSIFNASIMFSLIEYGKNDFFIRIISIYNRYHLSIY